ncbi:hypothetical protein Patl1_33422 [Pistacia atlantica]|uniref:Uncharacterized protein n=1 Tax=Pistacia atlantica TaxID=434234 RepID=A0ACC0ZT72_9ROSI|nr:hypothetical protein Patl1_33422 [Pistacia atlantica]
MGILEILRSYNWDAKAVLPLVAFAFNFGDFLVMAQPYASNPLLKSVPLLKELPKTQERVDTFKAKIVELSNPIKATLNMTKCIVEFIEFESHNTISFWNKRDIVSAVYWTIKCIVGCSSQILGLTGMGRGKEKGQKKRVKNFEKLMKEVHTDNIQVMKGLIYAKEDQLPLLKDMKITDEELFILKRMYRESHNDPTREGTVITYIKKVWNFKENPILVVIDPEGKVINNNALHIIWIWGSLAFPFTSSKEAELWEHETWTFEFLAGSIDAAIPIWRAEDNYMCLYGGGDMDWIKKFTSTAQRVAEATRIKLQILYVGKSNPGEQIHENISIITVEKLSYSLQDLTLVWVFWERLKSVKQSEMQLKSTLQNDPIMQEINTILSFDEKDEGWAVICRGSAMAMAKSEIILQCLTNFDLWRKYMNDQDFVIALNHYNRKFSLAQLIKSQHLDNMNVLRALIPTKEVQLPLLKGDTKTRKPILVALDRLGKVVNNYALHRYTFGEALHFLLQHLEGMPLERRHLVN